MGGPRRPFGLHSRELWHIRGAIRGKMPGKFESAPGRQQDAQDRWPAVSASGAAGGDAL
jgi:hypothetical protein